MKFTISDTLFYRLIFGIAAIIYTITAINSLGYYHADEHFQLIEFASLKLGTNTPIDLAWEYSANIRSTIQPYICYVIFQSLTFFNFTDAYTQTLVLRLITALMALIAINSFIQQTKNQFSIKIVKRIYYLLSYFLWFIPFISTRFSSETWSGIIFLMSLTTLLNTKITSNKPYLLGLLFGMSFLFRFQMIFAIIGLLLWMMKVGRENRYYMLKIILAFITVILLGFILDSLFYNKIVFTPWNYFYANIVEDVASNFGTRPWYFYILRVIAMPSYPLGIAIVIAFTILFFYYQKSKYLWVVVPFIIAHTIIPHKEARFMFPLVYLLPIVLTIAYGHIYEFLLKHKYVYSTSVIVLVVINVIGLTIMSQKAAGYGQIDISNYIHNTYGNEKIHLIHSNSANPYNPLKKVTQTFYKESNMTFLELNSLCETSNTVVINNSVNLLILRKQDLKNKNFTEFIEKNNFTLIRESIPSWMEYICNEYRFFKQREVLLLYVKND